MSRREDDIAAWKKWNANKTSANLDALNNRVAGLIHKEVNRWAGVISPQVLEVEAKRLAKLSYNTYDPHRGVALTTHLTNYLQKLSRKVYTHQNVARIPEYQILKLKNFKRSWDTLEDIHSREPSIGELAEHLKWSHKAVKEYVALLRSESTESVVPTSLFSQQSADPMLDMVYHDLTPQQQLIFEHTTGYGGKEVLVAKDIAKKLHISISKLQYEKRKLIKRVQELSV